MIKTKNLSFSYLEYEEIEELNDDDRELLISAMKSAANAYAPYSEFMVGAAVRLESGTIVNGTNIENAAFPSGICAERSAFAGAASNHPGDVPVALAVAAKSSDGFTGDPISPCGNCRQVISEEENRNHKPVRIILGGKRNIRIISTASDLLPLCFKMESHGFTHR